MKTEIRIPTLLGLGILLVGLAGGVFLVSQNQLAIFQTKAVKSAEPQKITLANLSGNSASIYWQTAENSPGFIKAGTSPSLELTFNDDRDEGAPKSYKLHYATLNNLSPKTIYYYKIVSGTNSYPTQLLSFKTPESVQNFPNSPLIGQVVDQNLQPVEEALINLSLPGNQNLATITKVSGNFILSLTDLPNLASKPETVLTAFNGEKSSKINLKLPFTQTFLPQIILGQDADLIPLESSNSASISLKDDLNGDGVVNSLDLGIIFNNFGKKGINVTGDLNKDGIVDQKDIDLLNSAVTGP